jgi:hypothetical protein
MEFKRGDIVEYTTHFNTTKFIRMYWSECCTLDTYGRPEYNSDAMLVLASSGDTQFFYSKLHEHHLFYNDGLQRLEYIGPKKWPKYKTGDVLISSYDCTDLIIVDTIYIGTGGELYYCLHDFDNETSRFNKSIKFIEEKYIKLDDLDITDKYMIITEGYDNNDGYYIKKHKFGPFWVWLSDYEVDERSEHIFKFWAQQYHDIQKVQKRILDDAIRTYKKKQEKEKEEYIAHNSYQKTKIVTLDEIKNSICPQQ